MQTDTYVLSYDDTPKSLNAGGAGSRRHWSKGHQEKKRWEGVWAMLMLARKARRGMVKVHVEAVLEFADSRRRDAENFRPAISKPLADALVRGGWLPDDTAEFFDFGYVKIVSGAELPSSNGNDKRRVRGRTVLTLEAEYGD